MMNRMEETEVTARQRIVVALGGNAIQQGNDATVSTQLKAMETTADALARLLLRGYELVVTHGNGPQVGQLVLQQAATRQQFPELPLDVCGAMTQGMIGYWFENTLTNAFRTHQLSQPVISLITRSVVDKGDPAFSRPTKPIGPFYTEAEMTALQAETTFSFRQDAGRGYRRVVPSPTPQTIVEAQAIRMLMDEGYVVIASGGGGVPVVDETTHYRGIEAVIDKDAAAATLAILVEADFLLILTTVDHVAIHYGTPYETPLTTVSREDLDVYRLRGEFAEGSMLPKVEAAMRFVASAPHRTAIITSLDRVEDAMEGRIGTHIR